MALIVFFIVSLRTTSIVYLGEAVPMDNLIFSVIFESLWAFSISKLAGTSDRLPGEYTSKTSLERGFFFCEKIFPI